uniref:CCHC-type domain-containing protein n=1 Tax=Setaria viridis TaxID=4556 RepID=A0A4U6U4C1_SETVI|nr:hypothetical protein SEVIR_6G012100v2 [Setaria viridis]
MAPNLAPSPPPRPAPALTAPRTPLRLRRGPPPPCRQDPRPPCPLPPTSPRARSSWEHFFSPSPPPPPRHGRPAPVSDEWVPESPDLRISSPDLRPPTTDLLPESQPGKRPSYAEAVRGGAFNSPPTPLARRNIEGLLPPARDGSSNSGDATAIRRIQPSTTSPATRTKRDTPPEIQPRQPSREWQPVTRRRTRQRAPPELPRRDGGSDRQYRTSSRKPPTAALLNFNRATEGRCFICLAPDHRAAFCRDPVRCFRCRRSGHKERDCKERTAASAASRHRTSISHRPTSAVPRPTINSRNAPATKAPRIPPSSAAPLPPSSRKTSNAMAIGDPHTRPEVETVFVSDSFHLAHDARDWEACALVPWALHLPPGAGARDIAGLLSRELRLRHGEVSVTLHQPEPYLIRFDNETQAAEARRRGRFTGGGIDICLRPWRSLTHALGFRIFYRVRLCLDGIPSHAWTPEIVERIIGHKCALQHIVTDLVQPADSRHIELWAWTVDPSEIPKKVWLAFVHSPATKSSAFSVSAEPPPTSWQQGARYEVFIHMPLLEDFTAAARNLEHAVNNPENITPIRRRYEWRYGLVDGAPPDARSRFPARLPRPPREPEQRDLDDHGDGRMPAHRRGGTGSSGAAGGGRGTHGDGGAAVGGQGRERQHRQVDRNRTKHRADQSTCKRGFTWPPRRGEDDDDDDDVHRDYNHPGHGRKFGDAYWGCAASGRRERTRSPPRRSYAPPQGHHHAQEQSTFNPSQLRALFQAQAATLTGNVQVTTPSNVFALKARNRGTDAGDFIRKFSAIADRLDFEDNSSGEKAWSATVPLPRVFDTLRTALLPAPPPPTVAEVEQALDAMIVGTKQRRSTMGRDADFNEGPLSTGVALQRVVLLPAPLPSVADVEQVPDATVVDRAAVSKEGPFSPEAALQQTPQLGQRPTSPGLSTSRSSGLMLGGGSAGRSLALPGTAGPTGLLPWAERHLPWWHGSGGGATAHFALAGAPPSSAHGAPQASPGSTAGHSAHAACRVKSQGRPTDLGLTPLNAQRGPPCNEREGDQDLRVMDSLFCIPPPSLLQEPGLRRQRQRRTFDMTAVRRSARLAKKPTMPVTEKAQRNLCKKLGLTNEELTPIDDVLRDFLSMFQGPLPETIVAALTTIFGLDDEGGDMIEDALLHHAGTAAAEPQLD